VTDGSDRVARTLRDLLAFAAMAERLVRRGRAAYDQEEALRLASEAILHKIGEAVARLPDDFIDSHPEIPWRAMRATRNLVAHRYEQVDHEILWNALVQRLPEHAQRIRAILEDLESGRRAPMTRWP
jgi:uncharacterized protein with HEPN domain